MAASESLPGKNGRLTGRIIDSTDFSQDHDSLLPEKARRFAAVARLVMGGLVFGVGKMEWLFRVWNEKVPE